MGKLYQKLKITANVLIIVVAVMFGFTLVQRYIYPSNPTNKPAKQPTVGTKVSLTDEDWSTQPKTLVMALQTTCHFCNESAPFYKRLIHATQGKNIKVVAVFPSGVEESTAHLNELGLTGLEVKQSSLDNLQTSGTPTLLLINDKGEITDYWVGKLSMDKEVDVLNKLDS